MGSMLKRMKKGFTMVELLVVLVIVAILAAVAAPIYMANVKRSIASEAVATMALMRQSERDRLVNGRAVAQITPAQALVLDTSIYGVFQIRPEVNQYFSSEAFSVAETTSFNPTIPSGELGSPASAVNFVIRANGDASVPCSGSVSINCAVKADQADDICLQMDNSGRIFVSYNSPGCVGGTWEQY